MTGEGSFWTFPRSIVSGFKAQFLWLEPQKLHSNPSVTFSSCVNLAFVPLFFSMDFIEFSLFHLLWVLSSACCWEPGKKSMGMADGRGATAGSTPYLFPAIHSAEKQCSLPRLPGTFHLTSSGPLCSHLPNEGWSLRRADAAPGPALGS